MKKNMWKITILVASFLFLTLKIPAHATPAQVSYGSESYSWKTGERVPIGIYIECQHAISSYEMEVSYDTEKLRYIDGASEQVGNHLIIRGSGEQNRYRNMLYFDVLEEGDTSITVVSASGTANIEEGDTTRAEALEIAEFPTAPIQIQVYVSNQLSGILIDGEELKEFEPDRYEYQLKVDTDKESVDVKALVENSDSPIDLSQKQLKYGTNEVSVDIVGTDGTQTYKVIFIRKPPVIVTDESIFHSQSNQDLSQNKDGVESGFFASFSRNVYVKRILSNLVLWILFLATVVLLVVYEIKLRKKKKKQVKKEAHKEQMEDALEVIDLNKVVVTISHVTMKFKMAQDEASSIKEYFIRAIKRQNQYRYLTALNNISFKVRQGDVVGIIGTNGSGKSTLLKVISGALRPTEGKVKVDRSKVQILTLGTGFDMELTAKENVYLNGAIIGYSKEYIDEKYNDIVEFAELEGFMDQKMKNFSSGMVSRLGFAIATMRDTPEILILDEVLSVGDMFFRKKSEKRIKEMIHSGATVFLVAHGMDTILKNCNKVVWIEKGVMKMAGNPQKVCEAYQNYSGREE